MSLAGTHNGQKDIYLHNVVICGSSLESAAKLLLVTRLAGFSGFEGCLCRDRAALLVIKLWNPSSAHNPKRRISLFGYNTNNTPVVGVYYMYERQKTPSQTLPVDEHSKGAKQREQIRRPICIYLHAVLPRLGDWSVFGDFEIVQHRGRNKMAGRRRKCLCRPSARFWFCVCVRHRQKITQKQHTLKQQKIRT